ncbi:MAG: TRAP transporter small permease [Rhodospirillales bacterium]|nr:TRAP transporter small permease [Rhodospirillales bacterium]
MEEKTTRSDRWIDFAYPLRIFVGCAFIVIVVLTVAQVFYRSVLDSPLIWSEEIVRLLLVWVVFLGGAVVVWDGRHLNVDVAFIRLPPPVKRVVKWINLLVALGFLSIFGWTSWKIVMLARFSEIGSITLSMSWVRAPATIGAALMIVFLLLRVFYRRRREADPATEETDPF